MSTKHGWGVLDQCAGVVGWGRVGWGGRSRHGPSGSPSRGPARDRPSLHARAKHDRCLRRADDHRTGPGSRVVGPAEVDVAPRRQRTRAIGRGGPRAVSLFFLEGWGTLAGGANHLGAMQAQGPAQVGISPRIPAVVSFHGNEFSTFYKVGDGFGDERVTDGGPRKPWESAPCPVREASPARRRGRAASELSCLPDIVRPQSPWPAAVLLDQAGMPKACVNLADPLQRHGPPGHRPGSL